MNWNFTNDRPIYAQIVEQIQLRILSGEYQAGQKLPSVRDMAAQAAVNPNTMQKALAELEAGGLVYSVRTSGRFITNDVEKISNIRRHYAEKSILEFVGCMTNLGYGTNETIALMKEIIEEETSNESNTVL